MRIVFAGAAVCLSAVRSIQIQSGQDESLAQTTADTQMLGALAGAMGGGGGAPPAPDGPTEQNAGSINLIENEKNMTLLPAPDAPGAQQ